MNVILAAVMLYLALFTNPVAVKPMENTGTIHVGRDGQ